MLVGYGLAVFAAFAYGYSAILQAQGARRAFESGSCRPGVLVRQKRLVAGVALDLSAWVVSRVSLIFLPLFAVQTVLAGSIAVTVVLAAIFLGSRLSVLDRFAIAATCVSLVVIGVAAVPNHGAEFGVGVRVGIVVALPVLAVAGVVAFRRFDAIVQAVLAGLAFVGSAFAARTLPFGAGWVDVVLSPATWSVLGYAVCGTWLHAVALAKGGAGQVTAAMWATEVVAAALFGVLWLDETVRPGWGVPVLFAFVAVLVATVMLARSSSAHATCHTAQGQVSA